MASESSAPVVDISLILPQALAAGQRAWVGVLIRLEPDWHVYWRAPGDAGMATSIRWSTSPGVTMGPLAWPAPVRFDDAGIIGYGYRDTVVLLSECSLDTLAPPGSITLSAQVRWLQCHDQCIPGSANLQGTIPITRETRPTESLRPWLAKVPTPPATDVLNVGEATWRRDSGTWILELPINGSAVDVIDQIFPIPPASGSIDHEKIRWQPQVVQIPFTALPDPGSQLTVVFAGPPQNVSANPIEPSAYELTVTLPANPIH